MEKVSHVNSDKWGPCGSHSHSFNLMSNQIWDYDAKTTTEGILKWQKNDEEHVNSKGDITVSNRMNMLREKE